ncbi:hypothetical protein J3L11_11055 [Shewanella sp. 4t3-1-2LB]|uniref:hypothetical protein n=1 Tax=Shewanella sp. 4t3-1-2LB TaxID=2817682 RepID=UPI001A97D386|nr:hypothetical protein [Shewanella sp. 4t3-1-2LB]MBO1272181.1 hypothetical protein [Shewanella sp. 4t3-1-2LB]
MQQIWLDLHNAGISNDAPMTIFEAHLLQDDNWAQACRDGDYVYVAFPFFCSFPNMKTK